MAAHNDAETLERCLASVRAQNFDDFEVVVIDDASTDGTSSLLEQNDLPGLRWTSNQRNLGEARTMNRAIRASKGAYIKFLHADDTLRPDSLQVLSSMLGEPNVAFAFSPREVELDAPHDPALRAWKDRYRTIHDGLGGLDRLNDGQPLLRAYLHQGVLKNCFAEPSGVMVSRTALEAVGGFHLEMVGHLDGDLLSRLCSAGRVGFSDEPLYVYRRSATSASSRRVARNLAFLDAAWSLEGLRRLRPLWSTEPLLKTLWRRELRDVARNLRSELALGPPGWKAKRAARLLAAVASPLPSRSLHGVIES